ncbi:MAG: efflux RND transporter permease subunit [Thermoguttaceae bacterium]|nr:efflux RND transporter permease subunit [Thermoguttaceae bacterium]
MNFIKYSINNPVKVIVGMLLTVLFGIISLFAIPTQLTPDVDRPLITVRTTWSGRSPEEIEQTIILEQEKRLKTLQGLYQMQSTASLGQSFVRLEFDVGYDITRAVLETTNRLDEVPDYPEDVDRPVVRAASAETDEAVAYGLIQAQSPGPGFEIAEFYDYADRFIKPALERVDGVAQVEIYGGREHQVQVRFDPNVLAQAGIKVTELEAALRADNVNESAGDWANGRQDIRFRVMGRFSDLEPIRKTIVKFDKGTPIYVEDIAEVNLLLAKRTFFDMSKGEPSMTIMFQREAGANVLDIMTKVKKRLAQMQEEGGLFRGYKNDLYKIRARLIYDDSVYITQAIDLVKSNMISGSILAIVVLLLFLRSMRPTIIIAISIPISVLATFIVMGMTGRTLNVISLAGLTFAVGMVVDNSIAVLENIDRHLHLGKPPKQAAYDGTREVWGAILSSTLTTVAVFGPVLTVKEEAGQLFYDIALAICAAILLSLVVAVTVVPSAAAKLLKEVKPSTNPVRIAFKSVFGLATVAAWCRDLYASMIHALTMRSVAGVWTRLVIFITVTIISVVLSYQMMPPASYLPLGNKNGIYGNMSLPPGYSLQQNTLTGRRINVMLKPYYEAKTTDDVKKITDKDPLIDLRTGQVVQNVPPIKEFFIVLSGARTFMMCTSADPLNVRPLQALVSKVLNSIPESRGMGSQQSLFGRMAGGNLVSFEVVCDDIARLRESAYYLQQKLIKRYSAAGVRTAPGEVVLTGPERQLRINQIKAKELGITTREIATAARAMLDGVDCGDFDFEGDTIDLVVVRNPAIPLAPDQIQELPLAVRDSDGTNKIVPLSEVVDFVPTEASQQIRRFEQERAIRIMVSLPEEKALEEVENEIMATVQDCRNEGGLTPDVRIIMSGSADKLAQTRAAMLGHWTGFNAPSIQSLLTSRFFLALLVTYLLMAGLFEDFLYPVVIMLSVPLAMVGGFLGLAYVNHLDPTQQLDTLTMLGFILLIGVVVNNAILLVHQALNFMRGYGESEEDVIEKLEPREAIRESVRTRLRPIFMTTATSVFGMLPLVLAPGAGSELYRGIGGVVVGGLTCSTIFTLMIVPLVFSLVIDAQLASRWARQSLFDFLFRRKKLPQNDVPQRPAA